MYDDQYEAFMDRISEPLNDGQIHLTEKGEDELLRTVLSDWLKMKKVTQEDVLSEDDGIETAEFIEKFGLQHLVSGGWTPLKKGA